ncbi:MAG: serine/threonine protein kinase [Fibromonadaceae bacterium]|jgi:serine/threonine protein kinase|nr:serine/threonine protein kinase [Fibromonadaceae bacterium]
MSDFPRPFNADYELLGVLGKGGMGSSVYKARQLKLNRTVALKVLDKQGDSEAEKRFFSEAQAMRELNHQNLATIFDYGIQDDKIFIAMTFVDGEVLSDIIKKQKTIPVRNAIYIAWQIAKGLEYAHSHGIVHRDIKPSNIMIKQNYDVCIIDFGISITNESMRLTSTGMTMGTPEYMSPEQCQNKNVTLQSDIYNLGIVFYEMLSGDPPFTGGAALAILNKHLSENPQPLRKKNPKVSPALEEIVSKCLEKKMENRYANFSEFLGDLGLLLNSDIPSTTTKSTLVNRLSKQERIMFLILSILPVLLILLVLLLTFRSVPETSPPVSYLNSKTWIIQQSVTSETPITSVFDGNLKTAWFVQKNSALKANNGILITIRFPKLTLITNLGIAIGDQSNWDNFQKYSKPKDILIRHTNTTIREHHVSEQSSNINISLRDRMGVQYPTNWVPVEVTELMFELKTVQNDSKTEDLAISEIRIIGVELDIAEK